MKNNNLTELDLFSDRLLNGDPPPGKEFFLKYFKSEAQKRLVIYYLYNPYRPTKTSRSFKRFYDGYCSFTGHRYCKYHIGTLLNKIIDIDLTFQEAEKKHDFETIALIRSGNYVPKKINFYSFWTTPNKKRKK